MQTVINNQYLTDTGLTANGLICTALYKTHGKWENGELFELSNMAFVQSWYFTPGTDETQVTEAEILHEIELNNWSRWNKELPQGQKVEVSEAIYYDLLGCVPPINMKGNYFEVGEAHHHLNNGKAIHRACWKEDNKYYTGYPNN